MTTNHRGLAASAFSTFFGDRCPSERNRTHVRSLRGIFSLVVGSVLLSAAFSWAVRDRGGLRNSSVAVSLARSEHVFHRLRACSMCNFSTGLPLCEATRVALAAAAGFSRGVLERPGAATCQR